MKIFTLELDLPNVGQQSAVLANRNNALACLACSLFSLSPYVCVCVCVCVCICVCVCVCMYMCAHMHECVCMQRVCVLVFVSVIVSI